MEKALVCRSHGNYVPLQFKKCELGNWIRIRVVITNWD